MEKVFIFYINIFTHIHNIKKNDLSVKLKKEKEDKIN